ncbi:MAG TPA: 50S ribosomal protein L6 [Candidatus Paceibacterota bacterium]|nr:50S ribosomal protein L6 [Candidatus Paceibacterota bacterium]HOK97444.1 50S ribosomal protein L6 [Candidatus Paceibacterota bacterium]
MSRIGKKPIEIPAGVEVKIENNTFIAKGEKGESSLKISPYFAVELKDNLVFVKPQVRQKNTNKLWGTTRALINNLIKGVSDGFTKQLEVNGVGFKVNIEEDKLILKVGFINPIVLKIPKDLNVSVDKNIITISGASKELVGLFAAKIRQIKPVEPYKGKGIYYVGEKIRRKAGKKIATTAA